MCEREGASPSRGTLVALVDEPSIQHTGHFFCLVTRPQMLRLQLAQKRFYLSTDFHHVGATGASGSPGAD